MKKRSLALLSTALFLSTVTFAQKTESQGGFHVGLKAGANIFKVDGAAIEDEFKFGYNAGAFAELYWSKEWGIQPEVMWNQTNYRTGNNFKDVYGIEGKNDIEGKLNYLSIPVLLCYRPVKLITFQAGPQFGILLNKDQDLFTNGKQAFKSGDFSMLGGAQLNLGGLKAGARYVIGLSNINDIDEKEKWKNQGFQVYLGVRII
jgi:hypothetical protein